ncbi:MAG: hypothetical protein HY760_09190 [Nitrospirae bacterium]|nr:hypothetical protein [Nitrospirota bacterium]
MADSSGCLRPGAGIILIVLGLGAVAVGRFLVGPLFLGVGFYLLYTHHFGAPQGPQG